MELSRSGRVSRLGSVGGAFLLSLVALSSPAAADDKKHWYDRISVRGYAQVRYNRIGATNPDLKNDHSGNAAGSFKSAPVKRARR